MNIGDLTASLNLDLSGFHSNMGIAVQSLGSLGSVGAQVNKSFGLIQAAAKPLTDFLIDTVKQGGAFEAQMLRLKAITQANDAQFKKMTKTARKLGETTEFTAKQAAEGFKYLSTAGVEVNDAIAMLPDTLNLATAAELTVAQAVDLSTSAMSAFKLEAKDMTKVNDSLVYTANNSGSNMKQLGAAFKSVASTASRFNYGIDETLGMLGILSKANLQGAKAGSSLEASIKNINKIWKKLGENGEGKNIVDTIEAINKAKWSDQNVIKVMGDEASRAILLLRKVVPQLKMFTNEVKGADGTTNNIVTTIRSGVNFALSEMQSAINDIKLDSFEGASDRIVNAVESMTKTIKDNEPQIAASVASMLESSAALFESGVVVFGWIGDFLDTVNMTAKAEGLAAGGALSWWEVIKAEFMDSLDNIDFFDWFLEDKDRVGDLVREWENLTDAERDLQSVEKKLQDLYAKANTKINTRLGQNTGVDSDLQAQIKRTEKLRDILKENEKIQNAPIYYNKKKLRETSKKLFALQKEKKYLDLNTASGKQRRDDIDKELTKIRELRNVLRQLINERKLITIDEFWGQNTPDDPWLIKARDAKAVNPTGDEDDEDDFIGIDNFEQKLSSIISNINVFKGLTQTGNSSLDGYHQNLAQIDAQYDQLIGKYKAEKTYNERRKGEISQLRAKAKELAKINYQYELQSNKLAALTELGTKASQLDFAIATAGMNDFEKSLAQVDLTYDQLTQKYKKEKILTSAIREQIALLREREKAQIKGAEAQKRQEKTEKLIEKKQNFEAEFEAAAYNSNDYQGFISQKTKLALDPRATKDLDSGMQDWSNDYKSLEQSVSNSMLQSIDKTNDSLAKFGMTASQVATYDLNKTINQLDSLKKEFPHAAQSIDKYKQNLIKLNGIEHPKTFEQGWNAALTRISSKMQTEGELWADTMTEVADTIVGDLGDGLVSALQGDLTSFRDFFKDFMQDIAGIFIKQATRMLVYQSMLKIFDIFGSSSSDTPGNTDNTGSLKLMDLFLTYEPEVKHTGGVVGNPTVTRRVSRSLFDNAPRFHDGLLPNEFPAILERGELVIPKDGWKYGNNTQQAGPTNNITVNISNSDEKGVMNALPKLRQTILDVVNSDIASNGSTRKTIKNYL